MQVGVGGVGGIEHTHPFLGKLFQIHAVLLETKISPQIKIFL